MATVIFAAIVNVAEVIDGSDLSNKDTNDFEIVSAGIARLISICWPAVVRASLRGSRTASRIHCASASTTSRSG